jgi:peptidyl-dipeptidase Dcp
MDELKRYASYRLTKALEAFKEKGIFDTEIATAYKEKILAKGGTMDAMEMYKNFRGREPEIKPLLERRGLN